MKRLIVLFLVAAILLVGCAKKAPEAAAPISTPATPPAPSVGQAMPGAAPQAEAKPVGDEKCTDSDGGKDYAVKGKDIWRE